MCSADAKLEDDEDREPLLEKTRAIGDQVAEALVDEFRGHNRNCGKHELALFRMSFLVDRDDELKEPLKQLLADKCGHRLREDVFTAFCRGLQEAIGNVSTDGKRIADENLADPPLESLRLEERKFRFSDRAGTGAHGSVNIYRSTSGTVASVAVKSPLAHDDDSLQTLAQCQRELALHLQAQGMGHDNVVEVMGALRVGTQLHIVMEDCSLGSLEGYLAKRLAGVTRNDDIGATQYRLLTLTLAHDVLAGLHYLHESSNVLHLDLKPANIYLRDDGTPILLDFGAARQTLHADLSTLHPMYTPGFAAPELATKKELGPWTDIYSIGATIFNCMVGVPPQSAHERRSDDRMEQFYRELESLYTPELVQLVRTSLMLDPLKRPQSVFALQKSMRDGISLTTTGAGHSLISRLRRFMG